MDPTRTPTLLLTDELHAGDYLLWTDRYTGLSYMRKIVETDRLDVDGRIAIYLLENSRKGTPIMVAPGQLVMGLAG